jgi:hypothetical protein
MAKRQAAVEFKIEEIRAGDAINLMPDLGFDIVGRLFGDSLYREINPIPAADSADARTANAL